MESRGRGWGWGVRREDGSQEAVGHLGEGRELDVQKMVLRGKKSVTFDELCRELGAENIEREGYEVFGESKSLSGHLMTSTDN